MELPEDSGVLKGFVNDAEANPISGANVKIGTEVRETFTDGYYSAVLLPGDYIVNVTADGFLNGTDAVTVAKDDVKWLNFSLEAVAGSLRVYVEDASTGDPVDGAIVLLEVTSASTPLYTNDQGFCDFINVQEGEYQLSVSATGYDDNSTTVTIVAGESDEVTVLLSPSTGGGGGVSLAVLGAAAAIVAVIAAVAALMLMKRKKKGGEVPPPPEQ
jgi:LPXTG-motif cell wall-anchored protein